MRVLVTGGAGYAGSVLAHQLLREGHRVRVLDAILYGGEALLGLQGQDGFEFVRADVRRRSDVRRALAGIDSVVHLAAIVGEPACDRRPALAVAVNLHSALVLHEECVRAGVGRFVFVSTCSLYGRTDGPADESTELRPVSLYGETKAAAERELLGSADGVALTVLRFATLFGLSPRMRFDLIVNEFTAELLTRGELEVYGPGLWRPYLHVRDAARALRLALAQPRSKVSGRVFNVGDGAQNFTKEELAQLVRRELGSNGRVQTGAMPDDPRDYRVSFDRIRKELGFRVTRTVTDGIREVADAIRLGAVGDPRDARYRNTPCR